MYVCTKCLIDAILTQYELKLTTTTMKTSELCVILDMHVCQIKKMYSWVSASENKQISQKEWFLRSELLVVVIWFFAPLTFLPLHSSCLLPSVWHDQRRFDPEPTVLQTAGCSDSTRGQNWTHCPSENRAGKGSFYLVPLPCTYNTRQELSIYVRACFIVRQFLLVWFVRLWAGSVSLCR